VALLFFDGKPLLLAADKPDSSAYLTVLRAHFQRLSAAIVARAAQRSPPQLDMRKLLVS